MVLLLGPAREFCALSLLTFSRAVVLTGAATCTEVVSPFDIALVDDSFRVTLDWCITCAIPELIASMYCCIKEPLFGGQNGGIILTGITGGVNTGTGMGIKPNIPAGFIELSMLKGSGLLLSSFPAMLKPT